MTDLAFGTELTQIPFREEDRDVWTRTFDRSGLLEELGFDFGTLGQHRFEPGWPSAPLTVLAAVAARTSKLRIGTGILVLPLEHPVALAEQTATIDEISHGRFFLGVGIGNRPSEADAMQVPFRSRAARTDEYLDVLRKLWTTEKVTVRGRYVELDEVSSYPKPVQQPHPPIWIAANFPPGFDRAARVGDAYYGGTLEPLPMLQPHLKRYREQAEALGRRSSVVLKRPLLIARSAADLRGQVERWLYGATSFRRLLARSGSHWMEEPEFLNRLISGEPIGLDDFLPDRAIIGTPEQCVEQIRRCQQMTNCDALQVSFNELHEHPDSYESQLRLFAEEVIPAFKA